MEKITYVVALNTAIARLNDLMEDDLAPTIEKLVDLRNATIKRNTKSDKPSAKEVAKQNADAELAESVVKVLEGATEPMTVTQIKDASEDFAEVKVQKLSAIVRKLMIDGTIVRNEVKRKAVFSLA
jgi:hypothetical protein